MFFCTVVDTTLLYVCTLWLGFFLLTVHRQVLTPLGFIQLEHQYHV
jgi:hypothetical protein